MNIQEISDAKRVIQKTFYLDCDVRKVMIRCAVECAVGLHYGQDRFCVRKILCQ